MIKQILFQNIALILLLGTLQRRSIYFFNIYNLQFTMANGEQFKTIKWEELYINYLTD